MSDQQNDLDDLFSKTFLSGIDIGKYYEGETSSYEDHMKIKQKITSDFSSTKDYPQHIDCITAYDEFDTRRLYTIKRHENLETNNIISNNIQHGLNNSNTLVGNRSELTSDNATQLSDQLQQGIYLHNGSNDSSSFLKTSISQSRFNQIPIPNAYINQQIISKPQFDNINSKSESIDAPTLPYQQLNTPQYHRFSQQQDMQYVPPNNTYYQNHSYPQNSHYQPYTALKTGQSSQTNQQIQPSRSIHPNTDFQQSTYQVSPVNQSFYVRNISPQISQPNNEQITEESFQKPETNQYQLDIPEITENKPDSSVFIKNPDNEVELTSPKKLSPIISPTTKSICRLDLTVSKNHLSKFKLYNAKSEIIEMEFVASLDGKFYVNNKYMMVGDDDTLPIACYRRNFNTILMSVYFSDTPKYLEIDDVYYEINNTRLSLDAKSNFSQSPIELAYFENLNVEKQPVNVVVMNDASLDLGIFKNRKNVKMQRFQFKKATPNNGKNIAKDYYYLFVTLSFDLVECTPSEINKRKLPFHQKIITLKTNSISVRGRNPSFYTERNDESISRNNSSCYKYFYDYVEDA